MAVLLRLGIDTTNTQKTINPDVLYYNDDKLYTSTGVGNATTIHLNVIDLDSSSNLRMGVYDSSNNLLAETAELTIQDGVNVGTLIPDIDIEDATDYRLCFIVDGFSDIAASSVSGDDYEGDSETYGPLPDPIRVAGDGDSDTDLEFTIWLEGSISIKKEPFIKLPPRFSMPELMIPNRKPTQRVKLGPDIPSSLLGYWLINDGNDIRRSLTGNNFIVDGDGTLAQWSAGLIFGTTGSYVRTDPLESRTSTASFTMVFRVHDPVIQIATYVGIDVGQGSGFWTVYTLSTNNTLGFYKENTGDNIDVVFATDSAVEDVITTYVIQVKAVGSTYVVTMWRNDGYYEQLIDSNPGTPLANNGELFMGGFVGGINFVQAYSSALPDALCKSLATDPHQFLIPEG